MSLSKQSLPSGVYLGTFYILQRSTVKRIIKWIASLILILIEEMCRDSMGGEVSKTITSQFPVSPPFVYPISSILANLGNFLPVLSF